jgi:hypothetical protein
VIACATGYAMESLGRKLNNNPSTRQDQLFHRRISHSSSNSSSGGSGEVAAGSASSCPSCSSTDTMFSRSAERMRNVCQSRRRCMRPLIRLVLRGKHISSPFCQPVYPFMNLILMANLHT